MPHTFTIISVLILVVTVYYYRFLMDLSASLFYYYISSSTKNTNLSTVQLFTVDEIQLYDGVSKPELYLVIMGSIFDVTIKGAKHYGPGKPYNIFVGQDSTRSYITGEMQNRALADDRIDDCTDADLKSLHNWRQFYHKEYPFIGYLIGRFYDESGDQTAYAKRIEKRILNAEELKHKSPSSNQVAQNLPRCNVEWSSEAGTHVWCSTRSGGVIRDWTGVPRKTYNLQDKRHYCVCFNNDINDKTDFKQIPPDLEEYEFCDKDATDCYFT